MRTHLILLLCSLITINSLAQERLYTDKEHGGAQRLLTRSMSHLQGSYPMKFRYQPSLERAV